MLWASGVVLPGRSWTCTIIEALEFYIYQYKAHRASSPSQAEIREETWGKRAGDTLTTSPERFLTFETLYSFNVILAGGDQTVTPWEMENPARTGRKLLTLWFCSDFRITIEADNWNLPGEKNHPEGIQRCKWVCEWKQEGAELQPVAPAHLGCCRTPKTHKWGSPLSIHKTSFNTSELQAV